MWLEDGRLWSLVRIFDNGPGIPDEHLPHIIDRFYRTDKVGSREADEADAQISASGLGLAIAKSIVEAYGGKMEVHSQLGKGSTFTIWLPGAEPAFVQ